MVTIKRHLKMVFAASTHGSHFCFYMQRTIDYILDAGIGNTCGIYYMAVGNGFYIGKSDNVRRRASQHATELTKMFESYLDDPSKVPDYHYQKFVFEHLVKNTHLDTIGFSMLEVCSKENLLVREQFWFDEAALFPNCFNLGFIAKLSSGEVKAINNKIRKNE